MKIIRHTASDMRSALRALRARLGPDAVILSSRRTPSGVEVSAAIDFDADELAAAQAAGFAASGAAQASLLTDSAVSAPASLPPAAIPAAFAHTPSAAAQAAPGVADAQGALPADALGRELRTLRRMLETQLAALAWNDLTRRAPIHTEVLRELTEIGIAQDLASQVVAQLPANIDFSTARRLAIANLSQRLLVTGDRWLESGGQIALVGPTGVGKTTALAKLAVRWTLRHGAKDLALIAADTVRMGAQDQVRGLGQLLGAPVHALDNFSELPALLARLAKCRFLLIDTPGSSQRDTQLASRLAALAAAGPRLMSVLVLAASTQAGANEEIVARFAPARATTCLLTKIDETTSLGGVLSVVMRAALPVAYVSEGQRVPEDLRPARSLELVSSAVQMAQVTGAAADEDLLRRRFGDVAHALA
jgi:flagellar biosynthesis protein FlhF